MQTIQVNIPARLKDLREEKNLSQGQVATRIGIGLRTYKSYEQGLAAPPVKLLLRLAIVYELNSLDRLLGIGERTKTEIP